MSTTLLPCPFCGARGDRLSIEDVNWFPIIYSVMCSNCSCAGPQIHHGKNTDSNYTKREAIEAWNTRSPKR
jgi:Lar family restriction alleviation protein